MKKILIVIIISFVLDTFLEKNTNLGPSYVEPGKDNSQLLLDAYENRQSDIQVSGEGVVDRILSDDTKGNQHQRFIVKLSSGQTILIAHNIDLAPRINPLYEGDIIEFYGEYEWNSKGGVVHWTHHDPQGSHEDGWLKHDNSIYQ